jgi:hypothetical protein
MRDERFKKKFSEKMKKAPREAEPEEEEKKDPRGPTCFECLRFGHIRTDCGTLKNGKGKAYNVTLSDESEEEAPECEKFLAFVAPLVEEEDSYYSEHSDNGEELNEAYKTLYVEYKKLREWRKQHLHDLNSLQTEKSSLLLRIQELEEKLLETQLQLERVIDEKLTRMLSIQKSPTDKTGLGYVAPPTDIPSTFKIVFVKPAVPEPPLIAEDKGKDKIYDDVQALRSLIPSEDLLYATTAVWVGMSDPSAPSLKHKKRRPRKKCPDQLIMALDRWPSIRIHGIRHPTKLLNIKLFGLMHLGTRHLSISDLNNDLYLPITVANPSTCKGRRRWKMINTSVSHLFGCKAWWSG